MTQKEKETLNRMLKDKHIDAKVKWIAIDKNKNILGFKKQPSFDIKNNEWHSSDKTQPVWFGMVSFENIESVKGYSMEKEMLISVSELKKFTKPNFTWDADLFDRVDVDLQDAYYNIRQLLETIPDDKTVCLCCKFGKTIKGSISGICWDEFDFTAADDGEMYTFKYWQMLLNKPPFSISDSNSICIHMNVEWEYYKKPYGIL